MKKRSFLVSLGSVMLGTAVYGNVQTIPALSSTEHIEKPPDTTVRDNIEFLFQPFEIESNTASTAVDITVQFRLIHEDSIQKSVEQQYSKVSSTVRTNQENLVVHKESLKSGSNNYTLDVRISAADSESGSQIVAQNTQSPKFNLTVPVSVPSDPVFHYKFGSNDLTDSSSNNNDLSGDDARATIESRSGYTVTSPNSATSSYTPPNYSNSAFSFGLWFRSESFNSSNGFVFYLENNYSLYQIKSDEFRLFFGPSDTSKYWNAALTTTTNSWDHFFFTYDGSSTGKLYKNGDKISENSDLPDLQDRQSSTSIGGDPQNKPVNDNSYVDNVMLYNRELTADEVQSIFDATK